VCALLPGVSFWCLMMMSASAADRLRRYGVLRPTNTRNVCHFTGKLQLITVKVKVNVDLYSALSWTHHTAPRYGTSSREISQFYLHTPRLSANGMNHTCLCLPAEAGTHLLTPEVWKAELAMGTCSVVCPWKSSVKRIRSVKTTKENSDSTAWN